MSDRSVSMVSPSLSLLIPCVLTTIVAAPHTQVDVFLDLAGPDSAAAWPTIRQVVWEYGFRTEFVFHILPAPRNEVAFYAAKVCLLSLVTLVV